MLFDQNGQFAAMNMNEVRQQQKSQGFGAGAAAHPQGGGIAPPTFRLGEKHPLFDVVRKVLSASGIRFTGRAFGPCMCAGAKGVGEDAIAAQTSPAFAERLFEACASVGPCPRKSVNKAAARISGSDGETNLGAPAGPGTFGQLMEKFKALDPATRVGLGATIFGGAIVGLMYFLDKRGEKTGGLAMSPDSQPWQQAGLAGSQTIDAPSYKEITEDDPMYHYLGEETDNKETTS